MEDIKALNGLTSNNLQIGQIIKIASSGSITEYQIQIIDLKLDKTYKEFFKQSYLLDLLNSKKLKVWEY